MVIGILMMAHAPLGQALMATLSHVHRGEPERVRCVDVVADQNPDEVVRLAQAAVDDLDAGDGVLVLVDICGATPANCAVRLVETHPSCTALVYGVSLPALLRAVCYRQLPLPELVAKVVDGGQRAVFAHEFEGSPSAGACPSID